MTYFLHNDETVCKNEADKLCILKEYIVEDENVDELDETQNGYYIFLALLPQHPPVAHV